MPTFVSDLPVHVLVVHAVVVLVPLAVLGSIVVVLWPAGRRRYGWLVVALTAVATVFIPIATSAGEGLEHSLPHSELIETHAELGDQLLVFVAAMLVLVAAFVTLHHRNTRQHSGQAPARREGPGTATAPPLAGPRRGIALALAALTIVFAVISVVQVYRIGDSGARAAWSDTEYVTPASGDQAPDEDD